MAYRYAYDDEEKEYKQPRLQTNRSMWKLMFLSIVTLGIYSIFFFIPFSFDIDKVSPKDDHSKTMNFVFAYILSLFTFSIVLDFWHYEIAGRIEEALSNRNINYNFQTKDFFFCIVLGSLILVGPFVYFHRLCKAMNLLCEDYNENLSVK